MQDRRFDELTRTLGKATNRRQVLKGFLGATIGGVFASVGVGATTTSAAADSCSSERVATCLSDVKARFKGAGALCKTWPRFGFLCSGGNRIFWGHAIAQCLQDSCPAGEICVDNKCCQQDQCCPEGTYCQGFSGAGLDNPAAPTCCAPGSTCCGGGCCPAEKMCCDEYSFPPFPEGYGQSPTISQVCTDVQTDPKHCGDCRTECTAKQVCQDGKCTCPPETTECSGLLNTTCCQPNERCVVDPISLGVSCDAVCGPCEDYRPDDPIGPCVPRECDVCQTCDPSSDQCVPSSDGSACGSGLVCCKETCVDGNCNQNQTFNPDTCKCECPPITCPDGETQDPVSCQCSGNGSGSGGCPPCQTLGDNGCAPDPSLDGQVCGTCGICSSGTCTPDPNKSCPTCNSCSSGGNCVPDADNTSCGSNLVCCNGTCTSGTACGPCPDGPNGQQCPTDLLGNQTCCYNGLPCCAAENGEAMCGPSNGVCCTVGTQILCGTTCCDAASEHCSYMSDGTGVCCPTGQYPVDDGTCCPDAQFCIINGSKTCCPSGQQCAHDPGGTVSVCCDSSYADSDGNCCSSGFVYANCTDGAYICCGTSESPDTCCANHGGAA